LKPHGLPKRKRVRDGREFTKILKRGRYAADAILVVNVRLTADRYLPTASGRLGVTIPRKTGGAVVRNRWKRVIREAYRIQQGQLPVGYDVIVRPRRGAHCDFHQVRRSLPKLVRRAVGPHEGKPRPSRKRRG
jgi:ribonuclease P protein component